MPRKMKRADFFALVPQHGRWILGDTPFAILFRCKSDGTSNTYKIRKIHRLQGWATEEFPRFTEIGIVVPTLVGRWNMW